MNVFMDGWKYDGFLLNVYIAHTMASDWKNYRAFWRNI